MTDSEKRLAEIKRRYAGWMDIKGNVISEDVAWLVAEVEQLQAELEAEKFRSRELRASLDGCIGKVASLVATKSTWISGDAGDSGGEQGASR